MALSTIGARKGAGKARPAPSLADSYPEGLRLVLSAVTRAALPAHSRSPSAFHLLKVQIEQIF